MAWTQFDILAFARIVACLFGHFNAIVLHYSAFSTLALNGNIHEI